METVIFIGIQASGKSTFYKQNFFRTYMHINLDMLKTRKREDIFIEACIKAKQPFVVDNTNPTIEDRKKYIDISKEAGFKVIAYYFEASMEKAFERNEKRVGKERIPTIAIASTTKKLQAPNCEEGFDEIYVVNICEKGDFIVAPWE